MNRSTEKYCKKGEHWVDRKLFYKNTQHSDGLQHYCMKCGESERRKLRQRKNEGTIKAF